MIGINFGTLVSAYRYLKFDLSDALKAGQFETCVEHLASEVTEENMKMAIALLGSLSNSLKPLGVANMDLSLNGRVCVVREEGIEFIKEIQNASTAAEYAALVRKIRQVALQHFLEPSKVKSLLAEKSRAMQTLITYTSLTSGLCGLYEMAVLRCPFIRDRETSVMLKSFVHPLFKLLKSFAETDVSVCEGEGTAMLNTVMRTVLNNQDKIKALCPPRSNTAHTVNYFSRISPDKFKEFYQLLKTALIHQMRAPESADRPISEQQILEFVKEQAQAVSDSLPPELKPNRAEIARQVAAAFGFQQDHDQGALLHGQEGLRMFQNQFFGEGINDTRDFTPIDPYNEHSLDMVQNDKGREKAREIGKTIADEFYLDRSLHRFRYTITGSEAIAEPIHDEIPMAMMTVSCVVRHDLSRHAADHGYLFGLDARQRMELIPEKTKNVILFGINHDIFTEAQIRALLPAHRLARDPQVIDALRAALARRDARQREQEFNDEAQRLVDMANNTQSF